MAEIEQRKHIAESGVYIPRPLEDFPKVPDSFLVEFKKLRSVKTDENFPFLDNSLRGIFNRFVITLGAFLIAFPLNKIRYGLKVRGRKNIRKNRKLLKNGAITVSNHIYRWDFLAVMESIKYRRVWVIVRKELLESSDLFFVRGIGGIPLAENLGGVRKFEQTLNHLHEKKYWFHIFPEGSRWDYYEPIRPFKRGAFRYSQKWNVPVIPMAFSYRKPTRLHKFFGVKHPLITLNIGEPIFPDKNLSQKQGENFLRQKAHEQIVKLAGIKQNLWCAEGD